MFDSPVFVCLLGSFLFRLPAFSVFEVHESVGHGRTIAEIGVFVNARASARTIRVQGGAATPL
jgi:hypothetical protein